MPTLRRTYKYRLYPTRLQEAELERQLGVACDLYNAALEQRRRMWRDHGVSIGFREQSSQLTEARAELPELAGMNALAQHEVLRKLDRAFAAFFRRLAAGEKPGYPRFRPRGRYDSITWAQYHHGVRIVDVGHRNGHVRLQGVGGVKFRAHRPLPDEAKLGQVTVRRQAGRWWLTIAVELPAPGREGSSGARDPGSARALGIDVGVHTFAALSTGELIEGPHAARNARRALRRASRKVSRRQRGSRSRKRAVRELARAQERVAATRRDHHHKLARRLVCEHEVIAVEDLRIANMTRSARGTVEQPGTNVRAKAGLNREILDQGWADFVARLEEKAEETGRRLVRVRPHGSSQECPACGATAPKLLAQRTHRCPSCAYTADRDVAAAQVIAQRGQDKLNGSDGTRVEDAALAAPLKPNPPRSASPRKPLERESESSLKTYRVPRAQPASRKPLERESESSRVRSRSAVGPGLGARKPLERESESSRVVHVSQGRAHESRRPLERESESSLVTTASGQHCEARKTLERRPESSPVGVVTTASPSRPRGVRP